ncbi:nucleotide pyrophosphohydrolase [Candidatus Babeliales bacterium]|nr:nucleotide pyrophosphohydrolase [Candidatus Babeliales bacterium]
MSDKKTTIEDLKNIMKQFVSERDWDQFHTPKNLSMALSAEAAELMELFLWCESSQSYKVADEKRQAASDELSDIVMYAIAFCNTTGIDLSSAIESKMEQNRKKYSVEKCKGKCLKYTEL